MNEKYLLPLSLMISSLIIGIGMYFIHLNNVSIEKIEENKVEEQSKTIKTVDPETEHIIGSPTAEIFIIEYSDLECGGCKAFAKIKKELIAKYADDERVAFVFRQFPLYKSVGGAEPIHLTSGVEAKALECVGDLGGNDKFFEMKDKIFATTNSDGQYPVENLSNLAEGMGIDAEEFKTCVASTEINERIEAAWQEAYDSGITATPSVFVQIKAANMSFEALPGFDTLNNAIESYLNNN